MIGMVLAAGAGRRLRPDTDALPKALLPVDGRVTILDIALRNLAAVGLRDIVIVVGYAADAVRDRAAALEREHGVRLTLVDNDRAEEWNNAYSLWLAREHFAAGALLVNGDTVHPVSIEKTLLAAAGRAGIVIAVDDVKRLADEEMKVITGPDGRLTRITKLMDPALAHGEYIGATLIGAQAAGPLAEALEATWRRDPSLYYEDGYQEFADRGGEKAALDDMRGRWPNARYAEDSARTAVHAQRIFDSNLWKPNTPLRVVLIGTDFEIRVWETLLSIPMGRASTYSDIAKKLGNPKASRAVGAAVGKNPVSFVVPCHRVLGKSGKLTGYHWGLTRKRAMLGWEAAQVA